MAAGARRAARGVSGVSVRHQLDIAGVLCRKPNTQRGRRKARFSDCVGAYAEFRVLRLRSSSAAVTHVAGGISRRLSRPPQEPPQALSARAGQTPGPPERGRSRRCTARMSLLGLKASLPAGVVEDQSRSENANPDPKKLRKTERLAENGGPEDRSRHHAKHHEGGAGRRQ